MRIGSALSALEKNNKKIKKKKKPEQPFENVQQFCSAFTMSNVVAIQFFSFIIVLHIGKDTIITFLLTCTCTL